jgi:hypothetical protein
MQSVFILCGHAADSIVQQACIGAENFVSVSINESNGLLCTCPIVIPDARGTRFLVKGRYVALCY